MKKPSRAGGGRPSKARSRRSSRLKRNIESKTTAPRSAATQQVWEWLENLGVSEYAQRFAKNGIDFSVLPHLTDQDLKDIGVLLGHRRKILAAVAELPGKSPSASKPFPPLVEASDRHTTEPPQPAPVAPPSTEAMGERRHVTVSQAVGERGKGQTRKNCGAHNPMQRRCADRPISRLRRVDEFR
jgi:hypothetical protein